MPELVLGRAFARRDGSSPEAVPAVGRGADLLPMSPTPTLMSVITMMVTTNWTRREAAFPQEVARQGRAIRGLQLEGGMVGGQDDLPMTGAVSVGMTLSSQ